MFNVYNFRSTINSYFFVGNKTYNWKIMYTFHAIYHIHVQIWPHIHAQNNFVKGNKNNFFTWLTIIIQTFILYTYVGTFKVKSINNFCLMFKPHTKGRYHLFNVILYKCKHEKNKFKNQITHKFNVMHKTIKCPRKKLHYIISSLFVL